MFKFTGDRFIVIWSCHHQTYTVYDENGKYFGITKYRFVDIASYLGRNYKQERL